MNPPGWLVDRLPEWARSIRYTLLYSACCSAWPRWSAAIYLVLLMSLRNEPVSVACSASTASASGLVSRVSSRAWSTPRP